MLEDLIPYDEQFRKLELNPPTFLVTSRIALEYSMKEN
jgi:hypothetical protein